VSGPVVSGRLLAPTRRMSRFPTAAAFASYAGVAPVEVSSAERIRHRLPSGGDRQLNYPLHVVAVNQIPMPHSVNRPGFVGGCVVYATSRSGVAVLACRW
jgi:transposase